MVDKKKMGNLLIGMRLAFTPASHQCLAHRIRNHAPRRASFQSSNAQPVYCLRSHGAPFIAHPYAFAPVSFPFAAAFAA